MSGPRIFTEFPQYSPEFWQHRRGRPSTSNFKRILTAKTNKLSASAEDYIAELAAEYVHFDPNFFTEKPRNRDMEHGTNCEPEARAWYALERNCDVQEVGGVMSVDGRLWSSPDGLVGDDGVLELKCPSMKTHVSYVLDESKLLDEYKAQCHGQLVVTERKWVDLVSYVVGLRPIIVRIEPNEFTRELRVALEVFWTRYQSTLARITATG